MKICDKLEFMNCMANSVLAIRTMTNVGMESKFPHTFIFDDIVVVKS